MCIFVHFVLSFFDGVCALECGCVHNLIKQSEKETPKYLGGNIWAARHSKNTRFLLKMKTCHPLLQNSKRAQKILPFLPKKRKYLPQTSRTLTCPGTFQHGLLRLCLSTKMRNAKSNYVLLTFFVFWIASVPFWLCIPYTFFVLKCFCKTW